MRALVVGMILIGSPAIVGANEESERVELMARIDDKVHAIADALAAQTLGEATARVHDVREMVARLATKKGNDARAADITAHYPAYADLTEAAIKQLAELGPKVHRTDGVAARCEKDDAALHELLKRRTTKPDANPSKDVDALAAKTDALAATWAPVLADLATVDHGLAGDVQASKLSLTDGYWMAVATRTATISKDAADTWATEYEAVTTACASLGAGQHHPDVAPVLEALRGKITSERSTAVQLVKDYNAWLATVRTLRELALQSRNSLRDTICDAKEGEVVSLVGTVATNWARDLGDRVTEATAEGTRLGKQDRAPRAIVDGIKATNAIVAAIARDEAQGRSNPKLVATLAAIAKRRDHELAGTKCAASNVSLDCAGTACTASCISITDRVCTIVEAAPAHDAAKAAGFARAQRLLDALLAGYARDKASLLGRTPALKRCEIVSRATLDLATTVVSYATCSAVTEAELGETLAAVPTNQ